MLFNSVHFAVFFLIVFALYMVLKHKWQNRLLLVASYVFYGSWDWRFLFLLFSMTVLDYMLGIMIYETKKKRDRGLFLGLSVSCNLAVLGFFKYFNFFATNLQQLLNLFDINSNLLFLNIVLPLGISFYTFQRMTYCIDIYRNQMKPTRNLVDFALFSSFFPVLVAGPIERATHLLPQIQSPRLVTLKNFYDGCYLVFWGLFEKMLIADNLAKIVDPTFAIHKSYYGLDILLATYAFAFQIFCDFDGYSNIARGLGKCLGFDIVVNFNLPYFATNPRAFWRRWNISLSTWLRDYLYIPLGGNRKGELNTYRNLMVTMLLGGLWHGAAWTYVLWGAYHGFLLVMHRLWEKLHIKSIRNTVVTRLWFIVRLVFFFQLISMGWLMFRAQSISQVYAMLSSLVNNFTLSTAFSTLLISTLPWVAIPVLMLLIIQVAQYRMNDLLIILKLRWPFRAIIYCAMILLLLIFGVTGAKEFIYFAF